MDKNLADPDLSPGMKWTNVISDLMVQQPPVGLTGFPFIVEAQHDGEGVGGQLLPIVVQAMSCRQGK